MRKRGREGGKQDKEKHITSTFNDRSTGSCICLRLDLYMSHGNKIQPVRLENNMHNVYPVLLSLKVEVIFFCYSWIRAS